MIKRFITTLNLLLLLCAAVSSCEGLDHLAAYRQVEEGYACAPADSLKRKAAAYLAQYADYHYGVTRQLVDGEGHPVTRTHPERYRTDTLFRAALDSMHCHLQAGEPLFDADTITPAFLRENIELAFDSWQKPWARSVPFTDFCRYVLPYRNGDEQLSGWRRYFKEKYEASILDSVSDPTSIREVVRYLMRRLERDIAYGQMFKDYGEHYLTPRQTELLHAVGCQALAHYGTLALRACGIPCATVKIGWRFTDISHHSILIPATGSNDTCFRVAPHDTWIDMPAEKDSMASWRALVQTYEPNPDLLDLLADTSVSRGFTLPVTRHDVTSLVSTTHTLRLPVPQPYRGKRHLFLCRFIQWQWVPIREGRVEGDSVTFRDVTIRQWYRLAYMSHHKAVPFGGTFTLDGGGQLLPYDCEGDTALFKLTYACQPEETRLTRSVTIFFWGADDQWNPYTGDAVLWGLNERTGEYRVFDESLRDTFKPVFHLLSVRLPRHTVFFDDTMPRPLGFVVQDPVSGEGYLQQY